HKSGTPDDWQLILQTPSHKVKLLFSPELVVRVAPATAGATTAPCRWIQWTTALSGTLTNTMPPLPHLTGATASVTSRSPSAHRSTRPRTRQRSRSLRLPTLLA